MQKRVDGPAIRDRRQREKEEEAKKEEERSRRMLRHVGGCMKSDVWRSERARGVLREGKEEKEGEREKERGRNPACIRYLSRRCCVQVNKLTRRRASAIFFPINLNLLLTLLPFAPFPFPPTSLLIPGTTPFSRRYLPAPLRLFVSTIDVLSSFLRAPLLLSFSLSSSFLPPSVAAFPG